MTPDNSGIKGFQAVRREGVLFVIDTANIKGCLYELNCPQKLNYRQLVKHIAGPRPIVDSYLYLSYPINSDNGNENFQKFHLEMSRQGFIVKLKRPKRINGKDGIFYKCDHDVMIATDLTRLLEWGQLPDTVVFVSGDSDFLYVAEIIKSYGHTVEFACTEQGLAKELKQIADKIYLIEDFHEQIIYDPTNGRNFTRPDDRPLN
jgi:uncharacterized LabA/DUF88 family protein